MSMDYRKPKKGKDLPEREFSGDWAINKFEGGRTKQAPSAACDINNIVARYERTGFLEHVRKTPGVYADATGYGDYHEMANRVTAAKQSFMMLPAELRLRFGNDPGQLLAFVSNDNNRDEAVQLGLIPAPPKPAVAKGGGDPEVPAAPAAGAGGSSGKKKPPVKKDGGSPPS